MNACLEATITPGLSTAAATCQFAPTIQPGLLVLVGGGSQKAPSSLVDIDSQPTHGDLRLKLYERLQPLVNRLIRNYGATAEMRGDLEGEIFCLYCKLLDEYDPDRGVPLLPYMIRCLTSHTYSFARKRWNIERRETALSIDDRCVSLVNPSYNPTDTWLETIDMQRFGAKLPEALKNLSERQQRVIIWRYYHEMSFEEIGQALGVVPSTARSLLRHGLNNLRKQLTDDQWDLM